MPIQRILNRLDEASNLSTREKMELWANGKRRENIGAAGEPKLDDFARVSIYLAEHTNDDAFAKRLLNNNVKALCSEFRSRGLLNVAQKYEAEYTRVMNKLNGLALEIDSFAREAFKLIADKCNKEQEEVKALADYSNTLLDQSNLPKNLTIGTGVDLNLLHIFDANSAMQTLRGSYLTDSKWGHNVVDSVTINLNGNIGVQDFAERLFWSLYNVSLLGAQTLMVAKKIAQLHPDMQLTFNAYLGYSTLLLPHFQINITLPDGTMQSFAAAYNLDYMIKVSYQEIKAREVVINISENNVINNYGFKAFALICKKFISKL